MQIEWLWNVCVSNPSRCLHLKAGSTADVGEPWSWSVLHKVNKIISPLLLRLRFKVIFCSKYTGKLLVSLRLPSWACRFLKTKKRRGSKQLVPVLCQIPWQACIYTCKELTFKKPGTAIVRKIFLKAPGRVPTSPSTWVTCSSIALTLAPTILTKPWELEATLEATKENVNPSPWFRHCLKLVPPICQFSGKSLSSLPIFFVSVVGSHWPPVRCHFESIKQQQVIACFFS